jgi:hypothetical protein
MKKELVNNCISPSFDGWLDSFKDPEMIYRPVPFWSWNESMEPEEIKRQIRLMVEAGMGGGFVHSRIGLTTPYLSEEWFKAVDATMEAARQYGQKVWLYDEDKWPSGFSGGTVPLADESFRMKVLIARSVDASLPVATKVEPIGKFVNGMQVYVWTAPLGHDWFNGTCYTDMMSRSAMRCFLDNAYEPYYERYKDDYGDLIFAQFTDEPCTIFRGRLPEGSVPYTDEILTRFEKIHDYDPVEKLHLLFVETPESKRFRLDYFRIVNELFEENFSAQLGQWCQAHNIALTGHYMCEHSLYDQQLWGVKIMPNYRHQSIPGIDNLSRQVNEKVTAKQCHSIVNQYGKERMLSELYGCSGGSLSFEDRLWIASQQICLGVNLLNPHLSLYTMAGCRKRDYPANLFYQQPWWPVNKEIDEPLSRLCVALTQGTYHAEALVIHPQESVQAIWKSRYPSQSDKLLDGYGVWDPEPTDIGVKEAVAELDTQFKAIVDEMLASQRTFDFGDETVLADDGEVIVLDSVPYLKVGLMNYPVVILPGMITIAASTVELLKAFQAAGGLVMCCGQAPQFMDGSISENLNQWISTVAHVSLAELPAKMSSVVMPAVELVASNRVDTKMLWAHIRNLKDGRRLVSLVNLHRMEKLDIAVRFPGQWKSASLLNIWTGEQQQLNCQADDCGLEIEMSFSPTQTHVFLLSKERCEDKCISIASEKIDQSIPLPKSSWVIERIDDNVITLDYASWKEGQSEWSARPMPVIAIQHRLNDLKYDGPLVLRYPVVVNKLDLDRKVHLVVEYPQRYQICVNGNPVEYAGLPFWRDIRWLPIDITGTLAEGENVIEMRCDHFQHGDLANVEDQMARYGTEIEAIYLIGDFAVMGQPLEEKPVSDHWEEFGLPPIGIQCFANQFYLCNQMPLSFGDTTVQGLPFYAGRLQFKTLLPTLDINNDFRVFVRIDQLDGAVAEVLVDGKRIGCFVSHPLKVDITEALSAGGHELTIVVYGTLRNLLGPHHHIWGELASIGPGEFLPTFNGQRDIPSSLLEWTNGQKKPVDWSDRYCMVTLGQIGHVSLEVVKL